MITIKNVTMQNFFSVGAVTQAVALDNSNLTLVLGSNLDVGNDTDNAKNAVGKTSLLNAISYALYGISLSNVKKGNLINKTNRKNMIVTITFEKNSTEYRIERGRSPTFLKFFINNNEQVITDESQGDSRKTQEDIEELLGMNHDVFKMIVALNTYTVPFLSMRAADQRTIIEHLLGITKLSEKADLLRGQIKETKDAIQIESTKISTMESSNVKITETIENLRRKQKQFFIKNKKEKEELELILSRTLHIDIEQELKNHEILQYIKEQKEVVSALTKNKNDIIQSLNNDNLIYEQLLSDIKQTEKFVCYACNQPLHDNVQNEMLDDKKQQLSDIDNTIMKKVQSIEKIDEELASLPPLPSVPDVHYNTIKEAYQHKNNLNSLQSKYEYVLNETDPYEEQIIELENTALQKIDWTEINTLSLYKEHQEFLLRLLTNKDSFVRKKIIDKNLAFLNSRLTHYLNELGLPHKIIFNNDLTVSISMLGQDLDFDNLSRGERTRLILGLSFSFRDIWENLQHSINLLLIDELLDSGLDGAGIEDALAVLKKLGRDRKKNVFLISHREELTGRVNNILNVVKENGFTHFEDS